MALLSNILPMINKKSFCIVLGCSGSVVAIGALFKTWELFHQKSDSDNTEEVHQKSDSDKNEDEKSCKEKENETEDTSKATIIRTIFSKPK